MKTTRKITALVLALIMLLGSLAAGTVTASAEYSGTCGKKGDNCTWNLAGGVLTISGTGEMADYPEDEPGWHTYLNDITIIVIEDGVTAIGEWDFYNCVNVTSVSLPSTLEKIRQCSFRFCTSLGVVVFPSSVTSVGAQAFASCSSLSAVHIPDTVTEIGDKAFWGCPVTMIMECVPGSAADKYAKKEGIRTEYYCDSFPDSLGKIPVPYKTVVYLDISPELLPEGTELWVDNNHIDKRDGRYSAYIGQRDSDKLCYIQVKMPGGAILKTCQVEITVDNGIFSVISSFFTNFLFNGFKWRDHTVSI